MNKLAAAVARLGVPAIHTTSLAAHRRLSEVSADPRLARVSDLELLVRAHGLPEERVWAVVDRVRRAALDPVLVWSWVMEYDGGELAELCASDLSDHDVSELVAERRLPVLVA